MNTATLRYILGGIIIACICILAGWYLFLADKKAQVDTARVGRGNDITAANTSSTGSTYANITTSAPTTPLPLIATTTSGKNARAWHVTTAPVAGMGFVKKNNTSLLYFVERGTGYILTANPETRSLDRLTNTLLPKIYEAHVSVSGEVILRSTDEVGDITTFIGRSTRSTTTVAGLEGQFFPPRITSIAWNPEGTRVAYTLNSNDGSTVWTARPDATEAQMVTTSGVRDWRLMWGESLMAVTRPSNNIPGSLYTLQGSAWKKEADSIPGLSVALAGSARMVSSIVDTPELVVQTKDSSPIVTPFPTIADKCAWLQTETPQKKWEPLRVFCGVPGQIPARFPDTWYQGAAYTSDALRIYDTRDGSSRTLELPLSTPTLDVVRPVADDTGTYVAFLDARDQSLWIVQTVE